MPEQCPTLTWQLAAEQLHAQGAVPPADLRVNAHVLGFNRRGEGAGGRSVVIDVPSENLWRRKGQEQLGGGRLLRREYGSRFVHVSCDRTAFSQFMLVKVSKDPSKQRLFEFRARGRNQARRKEGEMCRRWIKGCTFLRRRLRNWDRSSSAVILEENCWWSLWARPNEGQPRLADCQGWWTAARPLGGCSFPNSLKIQSNGH